MKKPIGPSKELIVLSRTTGLLPFEQFGKTERGQGPIKSNWGTLLMVLGLDVTADRNTETTNHSKVPTLSSTILAETSFATVLYPGARYANCLFIMLLNLALSQQGFRQLVLFRNCRFMKPLLWLTTSILQNKGFIIYSVCKIRVVRNLCILQEAIVSLCVPRWLVLLADLSFTIVEVASGHKSPSCTCHSCPASL